MGRERAPRRLNAQFLNGAWVAAFPDWTVRSPLGSTGRMIPSLARTLLVVLFVLGGCSPARAPAPASRTPSTRSNPDDPALCDPAHPGVETGSIDAGGAGVSDAKRTGALALVAKGACRRVTLALLDAGGAPATRTGRLVGALDSASGLVRFPLPVPVTEVGQADSAFGDGLVAAAYVVHGKEGKFFLDVHLDHAARASAHALDFPAGLLVDVGPVGGTVPVLERAPHAKNVVVIEPRPGPATYPLTIRGYARTFEANVIARLTSEGKVKASTFGTAADWATTWGEFELRIPEGPSGRVQLFVGEDSAKDGTPIGVTISLVMK